MSKRLQAGAYIIRDKGTHLVLHAKSVDFEEPRRSEVVLHDRDESIYRNQQIWWIEPIPYQEHINAYTITHTGTAQTLQAFGNRRSRGKLAISKSLGGTGQSWKIEMSFDTSESYTIMSVRDETVIHVTCQSTEGPDLCTDYEIPHLFTQRWEFLKPLVGIPPGWVRILNSATGHVLCHQYNMNPPTLITPSVPQHPQYREAWGAQWSFNKTKQAGPWSSKKETVYVAWAIKNRLTGGVLHVEEADDNVWTVQASENQQYDRSYSWHPDFGADGNWIIRNDSLDLLLGEGSQMQGEIPGNEIICKNRDFTRGGGESWLFRSAAEVDGDSAVDGCGQVDRHHPCTCPGSRSSKDMCGKT